MPVDYNDIFGRYMSNSIEPIATISHFKMDHDFEMDPKCDVTITGKLYACTFNKFNIKKVVVNPKKNATTVIFVDNSVEVVKRHPNDPEADIYSIVAYAVAKHVYGSNSAFKKEVTNKIEILKFREKNAEME